jgi:hypothetical protein
MTALVLARVLGDTGDALIVGAFVLSLFTAGSDSEIILTFTAIACWLAGDILSGDWTWAVADVALAVYAIWTNRRNRRRGRRGVTMLGEKSRAVIAGMVERVRESARPVPGRAG